MLSCDNDSNDILTNKNSFSKFIYCVGDSTTEGGSPGKSYPKYLQEIIGTNYQVFNEGHSGRESADLAVWTGGLTPVLKENLTILASGEVIISKRPIDITIGKFRGFQVKGKLGNVKGTLKLADDEITFSFIREEIGDIVTLPAGTEFIADGIKNLNDIVIWWTGQNDLAFGWPLNETAPRDCAIATFAKMPNANKRFLVISVTNGTTYYKNDVNKQNALLKAEFPNNYIDLQKIMIEDGLKMAGITPTTEDLQAIADERVPPSLLYDTVHPNDICKQKVIAPTIYNELKKRNWIN